MKKITATYITVITVIMFIIFVLPASALAATLTLSPATGTFNRGCEFAVSIDLDTAGAQTDGTDAILRYDPTRFSTNNSKISPNTSMYPDFPGNSVDEATGKITISGLASVATPFTGKGSLSTIRFSVLPNAPQTASAMTFDFDPNDKAKTTDSNVVERGTVADVLSTVFNGTYTVGTGTVCTQGSGTGTGTGTGLGQGQVGQIATPSATIQPTFQPIPPPKTLPPAGSEQLTYSIAIVGSILAVLGILGLALL